MISIEKLTLTDTFKNWRDKINALIYNQDELGERIGQFNPKFDTNVDIFVSEENDNTSVINYDSSNYTIVKVKSSVYNTTFVPADENTYAEKFIHYTAMVDTSLTFSGAVWANNEEPPQWGMKERNLLVRAIFIGGRVILNTIDNDQTMLNIEYLTVR